MIGFVWVKLHKEEGPITGGLAECATCQLGYSGSIERTGGQALGFLLCCLREPWRPLGQVPATVDRTDLRPVQRELMRRKFYPEAQPTKNSVHVASPVFKVPLAAKDGRSVTFSRPFLPLPSCPSPIWRLVGCPSTLRAFPRSSC